MAKARLVVEKNVLKYTAGTYSWTCPTDVYKIWITAIAGGGNGGLGNAATGGNHALAGGGGGSGGQCFEQEIAVVPGQIYQIIVGAQGQNTTFGVLGGANLLTLTAGANGATPAGGKGGTPNGIDGTNGNSVFDTVTSRGVGGNGALGARGGAYTAPATIGDNAQANTGGGGGGGASGSAGGLGAGGNLTLRY